MGNYLHNKSSNGYIFKTPSMNVRSQMQRIITYWIRKSDKNLCNKLSVDIINLIIETFTYQTVFDEENKSKLLNPEKYKERIQAQQTKKSTEPTNQSSRPSKYDHLFKLVLTGDTGVGKTALLRQYVENYQGGFHAGCRFIAPDFQLKTIEMDNKTIKLQIFDYMYDRFRHFDKYKYRGAHGILIVYDVCNEKTFQNIKQFNEEIDESGAASACRILVGNKTDLLNEYIDHGDSIVSKHMANELSKSLNIGYSIQTSADNGNNVTVAFESMVRLIMDKKINAEKRLKNPFYG